MRRLHKRPSNHVAGEHYYELVGISCDARDCVATETLNPVVISPNFAGLPKENVLKDWVILIRNQERICLCPEHGAVFMDMLLERSVLAKPDEVTVPPHVPEYPSNDFNRDVPQQQQFRDCLTCDGFGRMSTHFTGIKRLGGPICRICNGTGRLPA